MDQMIAQIENNPGMPRRDKDQWIDLLNSAKEAAEERTGYIACYVFNIVCSVLVVFGGINMLRLSGPVTPIISSILAMLPCVLTSCCCCLGLPVGIWALMVLNRPYVRSAMAQGSISEYSDEPDDR
jgi:hypothetical protein